MGLSKSPTQRRYSDEQKAQAVCLVRQVVAETGERTGAVARVAAQLGFGVESVRAGAKQAEIDAGVRPGATTADAERIRQLEYQRNACVTAPALAHCGNFAEEPVAFVVSGGGARSGEHRRGRSSPCVGGPSQEVARTEASGPARAMRGEQEGPHR